jgi:hypothetical protein
MADDIIQPERSEGNDGNNSGISQHQSSPTSYEEQERRAYEAERERQNKRNVELNRIEREYLVPHVYGWQRQYGLPIGPTWHMNKKWNDWILDYEQRQVLPDLDARYPNAKRNGEWCQRRFRLIRAYLKAHPGSRVPETRGPRGGTPANPGFVPDAIAGFKKADYEALFGVPPWTHDEFDEDPEQEERETVAERIRRVRQEMGLLEDEVINSKPTKPTPTGDGEVTRSRPTRDGIKDAKAKAKAKVKQVSILDDPDLWALIKPMHEAGMPQREISVELFKQHGRKVAQSSVHNIVAKWTGSDAEQ